MSAVRLIGSPEHKDLLVLEMDHPKRMFQGPDLDPLNGVYNDRSGIDLLVGELHRHPIRGRKPGLEIRLSSDLPEDGAESELASALRAFCFVKSEELGEQSQVMAKEARRALVRGGAFLGICLAVSTFFKGVEILPQLLNPLVTEGLVIAGWVAMWRPIELLLYDRRPDWENAGIYRAIAAMPVVVTSTGTTKEA